MRKTVMVVNCTPMATCTLVSSLKIKNMVWVLFIGSASALQPAPKTQDTPSNSIMGTGGADYLMDRENI